jgi:glycosyltransferase involved in cell wall biosynthesis
MLPVIFKGKSLIMLTEDVYYEFKQGALPFRYRLAYKIFANWAAKHAAKIMAISETSKQETSKLFEISLERIVVNQLGIDQPGQIGNRELGIGNYILYVGQAFPRRHLKETMLAYEKIVPKFPGLKLIAVGKDKYSPPVIEELKNKINHRLGYDGIIHKEYVPEDELQELYASAQALIYISSKEAFGLPPLEALARGTVPIVADSAVTREIFGNAAFFVENPDSPEAIAEAIKMALTDEQKRREIIQSAPETLAKYTWQKHTDKFLNIVRGFK